ncbi:MAG: hypothetical protein C0595_00035, partial [Marinilabiliales bacterium]
MQKAASRYTNMKASKIFFVLALLMLVSVNVNSQVNYENFLNLGQLKIQKEDYVGAVTDLNTAIYANKKGFKAYF